MPEDVQPGPVAETIAGDLAWLRVPDLSGFSEVQIAAEIETMFSKSGLWPEWVKWFEKRVNEIGLGLVKFIPGRTPIPTSGIPIFATEAHLRTPFRQQTVIFSRNKPFVEFVEE